MNLCPLKHTQIVNIWCHPSSIWKLLQVVGSFMVATDEDRQDRSFLLSWIISKKQTIEWLKHSLSYCVFKTFVCKLTCKRSAWFCTWPARPCTLGRPRCALPGSPRSRAGGPLSPLPSSPGRKWSHRSCQARHGSSLQWRSSSWTCETRIKSSSLCLAVVTFIFIWWQPKKQTWQPSTVFGCSYRSGKHLDKTVILLQCDVKSLVQNLFNNVKTIG